MLDIFINFICNKFEQAKAAYNTDASKLCFKGLSGLFRGGLFYFLSPSTIGQQAAIIPIGFLVDGLSQDVDLRLSLASINNKMRFFSEKGVDATNIDNKTKNINNCINCILIMSFVINTGLTVAYVVQGAEIGDFNKHQDEAASANNVAWVGAFTTSFLYYLNICTEHYLSSTIEDCDSLMEQLAN